MTHSGASRATVLGTRLPPISDGSGVAQRRSLSTMASARVAVSNRLSDCRLQHWAWLGECGRVAGSPAPLEPPWTYGARSPTVATHAVPLRPPRRRWSQSSETPKSVRGHENLLLGCGLFQHGMGVGAGPGTAGTYSTPWRQPMSSRARRIGRFSSRGASRGRPERLGAFAPGSAA